MAITKVRVKVNGVWSNLSKNSSTGKWEGSITAPAVTSYNQSGKYYPVTIEATNDAGTVSTVDATDATLGTALRLVVKETTKPVIKLVQPSNGTHTANNKLPIIFEVTDEANGSGVNGSSVTLKLGSDTYTPSSTGMVKTAITNGYRYTYTPQNALADGSKSITLNAKDNDGNAATAVTASYVVDTVPPTLTISSPQTGLITNNKDIVIKGSTNDALSSPVTVSVLQKTSESQITVDVGLLSDGTFTAAATLSEGSNEFVITATDAAKKSTSITVKVTLDTSVPKVTAVTLSPNPVNVSKSVTITLEVS